MARFSWVPSRLLPPEIPTVARAACRAALEGADAYRATRRAVQLTDGTLRIGNRFVRVDRYREIAFVAVGNAAVSQALAVTQTLGERVTQGFVAGPIPVPREIAFRDLLVPDMQPGSPEGEAAAHSALELAEGLRKEDLLLLLLSPGALGCLVAPPEGWDRYAFRHFLADLKSHGATPDEVTQVLRVLGGGAVGGQILRRMTGAEVLPLVVDRGDGGENVGGGPTRRVDLAERYAVRETLERTGQWGDLADPNRRAVVEEPAPPADGTRAERPVVIVGPGEALDAAGAAAAEKKWVARLGALTLKDPPERAAHQFLARVERTVEELGGIPTARGSVGLAVFAGVTLGTLEGSDEHREIEAFLQSAAKLLTRRNAAVLLFRTPGPRPGVDEPAGGMVDASGIERRREAVAEEVIPTAAGVTDVGSVAVAFVRPERPGSS